MGIGLQSTISQLGSGALDKMLVRSSQRCETFCGRRLQAPGQTTLLQSASIGDNQVYLTSTLTLDEKDEQALIIGSGNTQETVAIFSGGITVTSWTNPYPGTVNITTPLLYNHSAGEPVQMAYQEMEEIVDAGNPVTNDPYAEIVQTRTSPLTLTYVPPLGNTLTRTIFLKTYPILNLLAIDYSYFSSIWSSIDFSDGLSIVPNEGWYEFRVGQILLRDGIMRTTYIGGYQVIPDDIKLATSYYFAEQAMQMINPYGLIGLTMGKRSYRWEMRSEKSPLSAQAEDILCKYQVMHL